MRAGTDFPPLVLGPTPARVRKWLKGLNLYRAGPSVLDSRALHAEWWSADFMHDAVFEAKYSKLEAKCCSFDVGCDTSAAKKNKVLIQI